MGGLAMVKPGREYQHKLIAKAASMGREHVHTAPSNAKISGGYKLRIESRHLYSRPLDLDVRTSIQLHAPWRTWLKFATLSPELEQ